MRFHLLPIACKILFLVFTDRKSNLPLRKPRAVAQPSKLKSTQIYSQSVCSHVISPKDEYRDSLINPYHNFVRSDEGYITRKERVPHSDIRTLFKVFMKCQETLFGNCKHLLFLSFFILRFQYCMCTYLSTTKF